MSADRKAPACILMVIIGLQKGVVLRIIAFREKLFTPQFTRRDGTARLKSRPCPQLQGGFRQRLKK